MIYSYVIWPITAALWSAFSYIGIGSIEAVRPIHERQKSFIAGYMQDRSLLNAFSSEELRSLVSNNAETLNDFLKAEGFSIRLQPFAPLEFGVVSVLDIMLHWLHEGERTYISVGYEPEEFASYDAFELKKGFAVYHVEGYAHPFVAIETKSDTQAAGKDRVWLTVADEAVGDNELWANILKLRKLEKRQTNEYTHVVIPMIDYDQSFRLDWLLGLKIDDWYISQALQQTKFKMNEKGAHVKSAAAVAMMRSCAPMPSNKLMIDKPFYLWIEREGLPYPVFTAYLPEKLWKDPQELAC